MEWEWIVLFVLIIIFGLAINNSAGQTRDAVESLEKGLLDLIGIHRGKSARAVLEGIAEQTEIGHRDIDDAITAMHFTLERIEKIMIDLKYGLKK